MKKKMMAGAAMVPLLMMASAASAEGKSGFQLKPTLDARLRYEVVDQGALEAEAATLRVRPGVEAKAGLVTLLAEAEGTVALVDDYNAFGFVIADEQRRPQFALISDPENIELNRLQVQVGKGTEKVTLGRQRIVLDDHRWVGSGAWRQNDQTFDAVRAEGKLAGVTVDVAYSNSQRTSLGRDAGPRTAYDGDFVFAGAGSKLGPVQGKLFAYLIDYEEPFYLANSSKTIGGFLTGALPIGGKNKLNLRASYARQSDHGNNPFDYAADYLSLEGGTTVAGFNLSGGWEKLGSDNGRAVQAPMATLHKFNGWADLFLTTPANGLEDAYVSVTRKFDGVKALPGLNLAVAWHQFDSDVGDVEYGTEWDASLGFKVGKVGLLAKYADYEAKGFGLDTRKYWLSAEVAF